MIDQELFDAVLTNAIDVLRLSAHERALTFARLKDMEKELLKRLAEEDLDFSERKKLEKVIGDTDEIIDKHYKNIQDSIDKKGIAEMVADHAANALHVVFDKEAVAVPPSDYFKSLNSDVLIQGAPSADWWRGQSENIKTKFAAQVRQGLANGETNQQITARIVGKAGVPGVMDIARRDAASLVHTSIQTVANDARRQTFKANSDIVKGLKQVSTLDGHTSLTCVAYSGESWNLDFEPLGPKKLSYNGGTPRHFKCRSLEVPITKSFKEMGLNIPEAPATTRASSDGQVDVNTSFNDYLERKGKAYQDQVLGVGRADLWREGKITLKDLVDGQGRPVSLEALRAGVTSRTAKANEQSIGEILVKSNEKAKSEVLSKGFKDKNEHMAAFDNKSGNPISDVMKANGKSYIQTSDNFNKLVADPKNEIVAHHNHPINRPISLSPQDLMEVANNPGLKGLWAHSHEGSSFYAESDKLSQGAIKAVEVKLNKFFKPLVKAGYIDVKAFNDHYAHVVNLALHNQKKIVYSFEHSEAAKASFNKNKFYIGEFLKVFEQ